MESLGASDKVIRVVQELSLLPELDLMAVSKSDVLEELSDSDDGVAVNSYGQGKVSGVTFTVPAHGEIEVDFTLKMNCATPDDVKNMNDLIRGLLDASKQHEFDELEKTEVSGGLSFMTFWSGGAKASYSDTKHTMDKWGLSEENQQTIVKGMMELIQKQNVLRYKGTVHNREYDYSVSGNMFGIVMDAQIRQDQHSNQVRVLAPNAHMKGPDGETLPSVGDFSTDS